MATENRPFRGRQDAGRSGADRPPACRRLLEAELAEAARDHVPFVAIEAIKLVEGGLTQRCDEVRLIECSPAKQRQRLTMRGATAPDIERRLAAQGVDLAGTAQR